MSIRVRPELAGDVAGVRAVHLAAFPTPAEADLVDRLRGDADWVVAEVAEEEGNPPVLTGGLRGPQRNVVGHILVTRVRIDGAPEGALFGAIAPVGVKPTHQGRGIGGALCRCALEEARALGVRAVLCSVIRGTTRGSASCPQRGSDCGADGMARKRPSGW